MKPARSILLPDLDSNQDKQYQKLSYYHYTIGQSFLKASLRAAKVNTRSM